MRCARLPVCREDGCGWERRSEGGMRERYGSVEASEGPTRLAIGRVRLRSLARVGFSIGWVVSLLPALIVSALAAWVLHGIWGTIDGWTPWAPWNRDASVGP